MNNTRAVKESFDLISFHPYKINRITPIHWKKHQNRIFSKLDIGVIA